MFKYDTSPALFTQVTTGQTARGAVHQGGIVRQSSLGSQDIPDWSLAQDASQSQFYPATIRRVDTDLVMTLVPGYVWWDDPMGAAGGDKGWLYSMPEVSTVGLDDPSPPEFTVAVDESIYAKVERDGKGRVITPVEMVVAAVDLDPAHYQPVDPEQAAQNGTFEYIEIVTVKSIDGTLQPVQLHSGPIRFVTSLVGGENLGGFVEPYKKYDRATGINQFRTHKPSWGHSVTQQAETITHEFNGVNLGGGEGELLETKAQAAAGGSPEVAKIRTITTGPSGRQQATIDTTANHVRVYGNGKNGSLEHVDCDGLNTVLLTWQDGYITTAGNVSFIAGCGSNLPSASSGDVLWYNGTDWVVLSNPGATFNTDAYWFLVHDGTAPSYIEIEPSGV